LALHKELESSEGQFNLTLNTRQVMSETPSHIKEQNEILVRQLEEKAAQLEKANQELAKREAHLRAIFDTEPECVKLLADDGSLLEMNPAGLRMIEADSFQQVRRHCVFPLILDQYRKAFEELIKNVFSGGSGTLEFQIVGLKGGQRWLETHASPLRDESGKITALLGITRDITERKLAEKEIRAQLDELRRWQSVTMGRENRVLELKREVNELRKRLGEPVHYATQSVARDVVYP
jgi:PAS domain S-box-containing protein